MTEGSSHDDFPGLVAGLDYPMFVVTTAAAGRREGCLVGFLTQVSIHPPRLLVCLSDKNRTTALAQRADHLVVHFLGEGNLPLARLFGEETGDETDKFDRCSWRPGLDGIPVLEGTNGWVAVRIRASHVLGDHVGFVGDVVQARHAGSGRQLGYQSVRRLQAGHAP